MSLSSALEIMIFLHIVLSLIVTFKLYRKREDLDTFQLSAQCLMVWLIPLIGAAVIYSFVREDEKVFLKKQRNDTESNYGTGSEPPSSSD